MRVAVDAMGGDLGPGEIVEGARLAARELSLEVTLVGRGETISPLLGPEDPFWLKAATQVVEMSEHPAQAVRAKPDSSMNVCARLCRAGEADAWVSAGNSGGVMATALLVQGRVSGVQRPALGTVLPVSGGLCYFLDVGANVDCKPEYLVQFAQMGSVYAEKVLGLKAPRVALLSNGEEQVKGNELVQRSHTLLLEAQGLKFVGNVEPKDVLQGKADVVVADGFVGNVAIKMAEATAEFIFGAMRQEVPSTWKGRVGGLLIRPAVGRIRDRLDWREFGGAPLLGIDGIAVVAHGRSDRRAIRSALRVARQSVEAGLVDNIRQRVGR